VCLGFIALRIEVRAPPSRSAPRSGALVVDICNIELKNGPNQDSHHRRFTERTFETPTHAIAGNWDQLIFSAQCDQILISHSLIGQSLATGLLSLGPLNSRDEVGLLVDHPTPLPPQISVIKPRDSSGSITALNIEAPSVHVVVSKELLDGLQYLIDDVSQCLENFSQRTTKAGTSENGSPNLIGSRFFSKSRSNSGIASAISTFDDNKETILRIVVSEGTVLLGSGRMLCLNDPDSFPPGMGAET